ncbi:DUF2794 domain-containing protein [Hyphomicrobiales bacterium FT118]|uniref:DUF2794 domain-containing protein n=2 Tax=Futiania mangrovi TaxID=2959716 RepID=A0A9J6PDD1_9PROT|nr:DUF2794 domain-containing protein [Futiania mangrovii]MCP1336625.1 DUF2794 domain-containing protein [Futiania mangrovii]
MEESTPIPFLARAAAAAPAAARQAPPPITSFDRRELAQILRIYGQMVAAGEWRDYAIDCLSDRAVFSVFRRTSETPLYRIVKEPRFARRQGAFAVMTGTGHMLKRGRELAGVLKVLERKALKVLDGAD